MVGPRRARDYMSQLAWEQLETSMSLLTHTYMLPSDGLNSVENWWILVLKPIELILQRNQRTTGDMMEPFLPTEHDQ